MLEKRSPLLARHARENGWTVEGLAPSGHVRLRHGRTGKRYTVAASPSDHRASKNAISWMKKIERGFT
jgi:hypothetical protein